MYLLFREIGDAPHAVLMGAYNTKTEARMDLWQYEMFTDCKYNIKKPEAKDEAKK